MSGAFDIASRPMGLYLHHVLPYAHGGVYLVDGAGRVIASNRPSTGAGSVPPATTATAPGDGTVRDTSGARFLYTSVRVPATPWRLVLTVPASELYEPITAWNRVLPWIVLVAFALAGGALVVLFVRYREGRATARIDARTDMLTTLPNRRSMEESLDALVADHNRYGAALGVLMVDVDYFKSINDEHGHAAGDVVLQRVAARAASCIRINDHFGRWGGEEFMLLAPHTDRTGLGVVAERIRDAVQLQPVNLGSVEALVTVSVGGSVARPGDDAKRLVARADAALYTAKHTGRNRTVIADELSEPRFEVEVDATR